jgi:hypothetical protein
MESSRKTAIVVWTKDMEVLHGVWDLPEAQRLQEINLFEQLGI